MPSAQPMLVTEQATARVLLLDDAGTSAAWAVPELTCWGLPNEAKLRIWNDRPVVLVTDSYGFAGVFDREGGLLWWVDVTRAADPHSLELLPSGAVAVAGAVGDWVRVYGALSGQEFRAEARLPGAHGLAWDGRSDALWAIGHEHLVVWRWQERTRALIEIARFVLPSREGHDLVWRDDPGGILWLTTRAGAYAFDTRSGAWTDDVPAPIRDERDVKSIGTADGRILYTRAEEQWWTTTLRFGNGTTLVLDGAQIYKARWAVPA